MTFPTLSKHSGSMLVLLTLVAFSQRLQAVDTVVTADEAQVNQITNMVTYTGNVELVRGSFRMLADKIDYMQNKDSRVFTSYGNPVRVSWSPQQQPQQINQARAATIEYRDNGEPELILKGNAFIEIDNNSLTSETITYNFTTQVLKANGNDKRRLRFIITESKDTQ